MMNCRSARFTRILVLAGFVFLTFNGFAMAALDGGYDVTGELWAKAVLQVATTPVTPVTLVWKEVGADTTPSGDRVISGYFYADPADFAYGSPYNPEVFVKIYIATNGWCNIAFNHVTVDEVTIYSAHHYSEAADQTGSVNTGNRLLEHQYTGVGTTSGAGGSTPNLTYDPSLVATASGTYSLSGDTLNYLFTESDFPEGEGPEANTPLSSPVIELSDTTLKFITEDGETMTWSREQGQAGDLTGTWTNYDEDGDKFVLTAKTDGTLSLTGYRAVLDVPRDTMTIDGNFIDWSSRQLCFLDVDGPDCGNAPGLDLQEVYLAADDEFIYVRFVLNGPPDPTYGYKFGCRERHIYVRGGTGQGTIFYASGTGLPQINLPDDFVRVQGNQFECKFYRSDFQLYLGAEQSIAAWLDQGTQTLCRDHVDLPFLRLP